MDRLDECPELTVSSVSLTLDAAAPETPASIATPPVPAQPNSPNPLPAPVILEATVQPLSKAVALPIVSDLRPAPVSFPEEADGEETRVMVAKPPTKEPTADPTPVKQPTPQPSASVELPPSAESAPSGGSTGRIDAPPSPKREIKPQYPAICRQRGEKGDVSLRLRINVKGRVSDVQIVQSSGFPELDAAAERACRHAQFTPGKRDGKPVESSCHVTLRFKLD
ncbi:MAG: energy transducer TonB [Kiritimatiellae bacterium]|nr:energy transducer TonB [Kiritimatiellia bacterium]